MGRIERENAFLKSLNGKTLGVSFNAYRTKAYDGGGEENLTFQGTYCNNGGGLDVDTGIFTCPCGGTYMFQFHIATHDNKKALLSIRKNGEEALSNATMKDIMELADILNTNPQDFDMEAYADPLQYFEPDPPNDVKPEEVLEKLKKNDGELKEVNLNNICGISEQLFCDIFNALKNNDKCVKFSACNCD